MYTEKHLTEGGSRCRGHRGHGCQLHGLSQCGTSLAISYHWVLSFAEWHLWEGATMGSQDHRGLWTHRTYQVGAKWTREWKGDVGRAQGKLIISGRKKREKVVCVHESLCFFSWICPVCSYGCVIMYFYFMSLLLFSPQPCYFSFISN